MPSPHVLLNLAEAEMLAGDSERALALSNQAELIDQRVASRAHGLRVRISGPAGVDSLPENDAQICENVLGLKNVVVIDPDTDVLHAVREMLGVVGVKDIHTFEDGESAANHLKSSAEPDLILMEWRIPRLAGPILAQRIRQQGFLTVPVIVMSSLTHREDKPLLKEMSVDDVLCKPFDRQTFFAALIWTLQQNRCPTEQKSMDRKIRRLLSQGKNGEAQRLVAQVLIDPRIGDAFKKEIAAEYEYSVGNYQAAAKLGAEALKIGGDSISLLNLLGKALYQLKQYEGALKCFEKGHVISPMNIEKLLNMAELRLELGRPAEAVEALQKAETLDSDNAALAPAQVKVALEQGDTKEAAGLMGELESGNRLVAYMNNRAVLLTLSGRFEDGIALYERALAAIPDKWRGLRDIVAYNCALAHARYGDYEQCLKTLKTLTPQEESLNKKVRSLGAKVQSAKKGKYTLQLNDTEERPISSSAEGATIQHTDFEELVAKVEAKRGDLCAYLVYRHLEGHDPKIAEALEDSPHFRTRPPIKPGVTALKKAG